MVITMDFRRAETKDLAALRAIAHDSEAYWGYDQAFMNVFDQTFNITAAFIRENPVYIGWEDHQPVCFWGALPKGAMLTGRSCELEYFYVSAKHMGKGLGKIMWEHFMEWCRHSTITEVSLVTSPQATGFYEKMGCIFSGTAISPIDGRPIPQLLYRL